MEGIIAIKLSCTRPLEPPFEPTIVEFPPKNAAILWNGISDGLTGQYLYPVHPLGDGKIRGSILAKFKIYYLGPINDWPHNTKEEILEAIYPGNDQNAYIAWLVSKQPNDRKIITISNSILALFVSGDSTVLSQTFIKVLKQKHN